MTSAKRMAKPLSLTATTIKPDVCLSSLHGVHPRTHSGHSVKKKTHRHTHTHTFTHTQMRGSLSAVRSIAPNKHPSIQMQTNNNANNTSGQRS
mmetsp:Transcript_52088/g.130868  ORF Transcript_52088/g.130868 Transcript_52088/m.130868 type:complete len:93 (-) Transcript_52088:477-755(-)